MLQPESEVRRPQQLISLNEYFVSVKRHTVEYRLMAMCRCRTIIITKNIKDSGTAGLRTVL